MEFRLLIADDSEIQIDSILEYVNWESLGVTEIRTASDGIEAYEIIQEFRPHILILDVEMPRLDGLELAYKLKEEDIDVKIIFISCHEKFAYAQKAMSYGGCAYILKPISYTEIEDVVDGVMDKLRKENAAMSIREDFIKKQKSFEEKFPFYNEDAGEKQDIFDIQREITGFIEKNRTEDISLYFESKYFSSIRGKSFDYIKYVCYSIANALQLVIKDRGVDLKKLFGNENIVWDKLATFTNETDIINWLGNLLAMMVRHITEIEEDKHEKMVERIKERIDSDVYSVVSVEQIARELNVSPSHAKNVFKTLTGITIFDYLFDRRMKEAKYLLDKTDMHIYEIAENLGYSSQAYFSIAFRKQFGIKPNDYRKSREQQ